MKHNDNIVNDRLRKKSFVILGLFALVVSLGLVIASMSGAASADADRTELTGMSGGWASLFEETFESEPGSEWTIYDVDADTGGEYYWARTEQEASGGSYSVWATGGGGDGEALTPGAHDYPNGAGAIMVRDPIDLSEQNDARLVFDVWYETQPTHDALSVELSKDDSTYMPVAVYSGDSGGWQTETLDLSAFAGESSVYLRFYFRSDGSITDRGVFLDNMSLDGLTAVNLLMPVIRKDPTPTPLPYYYFDDYSDPESGWPRIDHTWDSQDCWKWYYSDQETYNNDICDDRTDVKVSPLVRLPEDDYVVEVTGRFRRNTGMWWTAYGILFDAKDELRPGKPDLGDYYMLWVLWEGQGKHKWKILRDVPGKQENVTSWRILDGSYYNYGDGTEFNTWRIERTQDRIAVFVNGHQLANVAEPRPTTNNQVLFGLYSSTYETAVNQVAFDNYLVDYLNADALADRPYWSPSGEVPIVVSSGQFELEHLLPGADGDLGPHE